MVEACYEYYMLQSNKKKGFSPLFLFLFTPLALGMVAIMLVVY